MKNASQGHYSEVKKIEYLYKVDQRQHDHIFIKRILQVEVVCAGIHLISQKAQIFAY